MDAMLVHVIMGFLITVSTKFEELRGENDSRSFST